MFCFDLAVGQAMWIRFRRNIVRARTVPGLIGLVVEEEAAVLEVGEALSSSGGGFVVHGVVELCHGGAVFGEDVVGDVEQVVCGGVGVGGLFSLGAGVGFGGEVARDARVAELGQQAVVDLAGLRVVVCGRAADGVGRTGLRPIGAGALGDGDHGRPTGFERGLRFGVDIPLEGRGPLSLPSPSLTVRPLRGGVFGAFGVFGVADEHPPQVVEAAARHLFGLIGPEIVGSMRLHQQAVGQPRALREVPATDRYFGGEHGGAEDGRRRADAQARIRVATLPALFVGTQIGYRVGLFAQDEHGCTELVGMPHPTARAGGTGENHSVDLAGQPHILRRVAQRGRAVTVADDVAQSRHGYPAGVLGVELAGGVEGGDVTGHDVAADLGQLR
ncbi:hypothetical protein B7C42_06052 [Nocardia cerradoensis]|uniref:Uncharacterized protein n=1 Tax=Nocardia cerradoensis TaxID=85688 RepID=A0A231GYP6_9NOCA|nr:hypothetical protein B7C42_08150 [Nocardia cerradoensis]OXR41710.1 hypothetical protein B7C42_06052 [Nocardia cerradoensis]